MLSYETVEPRTLELLKSLMQEPAFNDMRLVGGNNESYLFRGRRNAAYA